MNLTLERDGLATNLSLLAGILDAKTVIEILATVRIEGLDGQISLASHSLDRCLSATLAAEVSEPSAACLPLLQLSNIIGNSAKGSTVTIVTDADKAVVKIGRARYQLPVLPAGDFPVMLAPEGAPLVMPSSDFLSLIEGVSYAMGDDISRPWTGSVYLYRRGGEIVAIAENGHRVAQVSEPIAAGQSFPSLSNSGIMIPDSSIATLKKFCTGPLSIVMTDKLMSVTREDGANYATKLLDGSYPNFDKMIPEMPATGCIVTRADLISACTRLMGIMDRSTKDIGSSVALSWAEPTYEMGLAITNTFNPLATGNETIEAEVSGTLTIKCQLRYLAEAASHLDGDEICIRASAVNAPIFMFSPTNEAARAVIQPVSR